MNTEKIRITKSDVGEMPANLLQSIAPKTHSFFPNDKGKDFYPMNHIRYSGKVTVVYYGKVNGQDHYQAERWHNAAQHNASATINVGKFVERYQCNPMEAHVFYPETFNQPINRS